MVRPTLVLLVALAGCEPQTLSRHVYEHEQLAWQYAARGDARAADAERRKAQHERDRLNHMERSAARYDVDW